MSNADISINCVYDIRDLLVPNFDPAASDVGPTQTELTTAMIRLIQDSVAPETWCDNGGDVGYIRVIDGQLTVRQTANNQAEISRLLKQFRDSRASSINDAGSALVVPAPDAFNTANAQTLAPSREKAYLQYRWAIAQTPGPTKFTDDAIYRFLANHTEVGRDELPSCEAWCAYVREARKSHGESKNSSRAGRTGRSVKGSEEL